MKRYFYYIGGAVLIFLLLLMINALEPVKRFNDTITLRSKDKIPYGTSAAYALLPAVFPSSSINFSAASPLWPDRQDSNEAIILVADSFDADEEEMLQILDYVSEGNNIILVTFSIAGEARKYFELRMSPIPLMEQSSGIKLKQPFFKADSAYNYPGISRVYPVSYYNDTIATVLGTDVRGRPNFFEFRKGKGKIFLHLSPLHFTNYFLLYDNNIHYYEQVISVLGHPSVVEWNEALLTPPPAAEGDSEWLTSLLKYKSFQWSFYLALMTLALFLLLGMRRNQRMLPLHTAPRNDSLDFIKTMGQLYYEKGDHRNLALKMKIFFLDHIRSNYHLKTSELDEEFIRELHFKTDYPADKLQLLLKSFYKIENSAVIPESQLLELYQQLTLFYNKTGAWQKNSSRHASISQN